MTVKVAVIYYSATGTVRALAEAVADGARSAGAEVRLRSVAEHATTRETTAGAATAGEATTGGATAGGPTAGKATTGETTTGETTAGGATAGGATTAEATTPEATAELEDLAWADAFAFGTPTRFGTPAAPLKRFIDGSVALWRDGRLADKPVTAFTSAHNRHGGSEATILSLGNVFYHWGALIVPPGYTDPAVYAAGGNPYGSSATGGAPDDAALEAARYQGRRLATIAGRLAAGAR